MQWTKLYKNLKRRIKVEIIAKTKDGCLIQASEKEVEEILRSVQGSVPEKINIGQKIPAIDYATTITKIKTLEDNYSYTSMLSKIEEFNEFIDEIKLSIKNASLIKI